MQQLIHSAAFYLHITIGSLALVVFWLPLIAKKGSANHIRFGNWFAKGMYAVSISGVLMSSLVLADPIGIRYPLNDFSVERIAQIAAQQRIFAGFLLMLSVLVFSNVKQSLLVLKAKANRELLKTPFHLATLTVLGVMGAVMAWIGITQQIILFQIFSVLSMLNAFGGFRYIFKETLKKREWVIAHLGNIVGAGIGAYTAFFAFGGRRFLSEIFTGQLQVIPWIVPGVVGISLMTYFNRKYRQQYRVQ